MSLFTLPVFKIILPFFLKYIHSLDSPFFKSRHFGANQTSMCPILIKLKKILLWRIVNFQVSVKYLFSVFNQFYKTKKHKVEDLKAIKFGRNNIYLREKVIGE